MSRAQSDDLQKLRLILTRATELAAEHALPSVMVGLAGRDSDPDFPEMVDYVESELRVEDAIYRMTRDRVVLYVADVDLAGAREIMERILLGYCERSTRAQDPDVALSYLEVGAGTRTLTIKDVLPALFAPNLATPEAS